MKQLLFLLLFPCLCVAQYTGNAGQKITLGEQTTADGLVFRGVENDTALITPLSDTSAYIILDTINNRFFHYKRNTNIWSVAGGSDTSLIAYVNTYGTQTVNGAKTFTSDIIGARFRPTASTATGTGMFLPAANTLGFSTNGTNKLFISSVGNLSTDSLSKTTATYKTFEIGKGAGTTILSGRLDGLNDFLIGLNFYYDGGSNLKYIGNGYASYYQQNDGNHKFFTSSSGSANGNITFTESMRLTENGSLRIYGNNLPLIVSSNNATTLYTTYQYNTTTDVGYIGNGVGVITGGAASDFGITASAGNLVFAAGGFTERMKITSGGNVGIGTATPLSKLNVMGTVRINSASAPDANYYLQLEDSDSQKAKARVWDTYSDKRTKTDIQPIYNAIDKVNLLNPVYYQKHDSYVENDFLNIDYESSVKSLGFIAQEVYNVIPEAVNTGTTNELWAMDYTKIIPILTKAIQEQNALIKALEQRILTLENK